MSFDPITPDEVLQGIPYADKIILNGFTSPGVAIVTGGGSPRKWDVRDPYGMSGASCIYTGRKLAEFDVEIQLWERQHFIQWDGFAMAVLNDTPPRVSLGVVHPLINAMPLRVHQVVVTDVSQFNVDDYGLWTCHIKLLQFKAPQPALIKPFEGPPGTTAAIGPPPPPDPDIARIIAGSSRIQELGDELAKK